MLALSCILSIISSYVLMIGRGRFWDPVMDWLEPPPAEWPAVDIVIPARNEAESLPDALPSILKQDYPGKYRVFLVNDHSEDGTSELALTLAKDYKAKTKLTVIDAPDLPEGWSGKVAAMQAGYAATKAPLILFTDADIRHEPFALRHLVARAEKNEFDLTSLMVKLNCETLVEKLLIPAFVFFFAMLYPFRRANNQRSKLAAAAGGVMLLRREKLDESGGLEAIKGALIDDCSLAASIKRVGGKTCLTLTKDVRSLRPYTAPQDVHDMIARTAFTQLRHSVPLLIGCVVAMFAIFLAPVWAVMTMELQLLFLGGIAWLLLAALYAPMIVFYNLPIFYAATIPFAALFYIIATIDSARRTFAGRGGMWKGRMQSQ